MLNKLKVQLNFKLTNLIMYEWKSENGWVKKGSWVKKRRRVKKGSWVKKRRKTSRDIMSHQFDWNLKPLSNRLGKKGEKSRKLTLYIFHKIVFGVVLFILGDIGVAIFSVIRIFFIFIEKRFLFFRHKYKRTFLLSS